MKRSPVAVGLLLIGIAVASACTQDFDAFRVSEGDSSVSAGAAGSAGSSSGGFAGTGGRDGSSGAAGQAGDPGGADAGDVSCPAGQKSCNGTCVLETNPSFGCAASSCAPCPSEHAQIACDTTGACAVEQCHAGFANCNGAASDGCEVELKNGDPDNCNGCGNVCVIQNADAACVAGECKVGQCRTGFADCDGDGLSCEANTLGPVRCGSCNNDCTLNPGNWVCDNGTCEISSCPLGTADCDGNPASCETDTTTSPVHCGFCNNPCALPNAQASCQSSACVISQCDPGFADCNANPDDGCEANLMARTDHCGACNRACAPSNTASVTCSGGQCTSSCQAGWGNCTRPDAPAADDGCETNVLSNASNCGACGRGCSGSSATALSCSLGRCDSPCQPGFGNCVAPLAPVADDGCESPLASSTSHCGACGRACSGVNVLAPACTSGTCGSTCQAGFMNCRRPAAPALDDGCEAALATDPDNCGACGRVCTSTHVAIRSCFAGACNSSCQAGWGNCSKPAAPGVDNGCESDLNASVSHCGACGRTCSNANVNAIGCSNGICTSSCDSSFGNCNRPPAPQPDDGCEIDTATNVQHCGGCGRPCSTVNTVTLSCSNGGCDSSCQSGAGNCSEPGAPLVDDGCEVDTRTDVSHCGTCGRACSPANVTSRACTSGVCTSACDLGFGNCGVPAAPAADNGCELNVKEHATSCGGCGNSCTAQNGLVCGQGSNPDNFCGCGGQPTRCRTNGNGTCLSSGLCQCPLTLGSVTCKAGEVCVKTGIIDHACSCNGGGACGAGQTCCQTPAGCRNLSSDPSSCGACGHVCAPSFACSSAQCMCTTAAQCNAGTAGTCNGSGRCVCGGTTCSEGERCLPSGTCG